MLTGHSSFLICCAGGGWNPKRRKPNTPNYAEARGAESRADFIHKMRIALKELNETSIWLRVIKEGFDVDAEIVSSLIAENTELCRIVVASVQTAKRNQMRNDE